MYQFTIIIPHKNIPHLLRRCLDSIPKREDLQIIVVDDNSNLSEEEFNNFPGINEKNTEVYFTREGKGAGYARNIGLEHAKGKWILFADSDDMFMPEIEIIFESIKNKDYDIIFFDICSKDSITIKENNESLYFNNCIINHQNGISIKYKWEVPWGKIINKTLLDYNNIEFEETQCCNDARFSIMCDFYSKKINVIPIKAYCWMFRNDSLWHKKNIKWAEIRFNVFLRIAKFMRKKNTELFDIYNKKSHMYLNMTLNFSKRSYIKCLIKYGLHLKSINILLVLVPKTIVYFLFKYITNKIITSKMAIK